MDGESDTGEPEPLSPPVKPTLPPVVLVMVTHDPGDWFEESLLSIEQQDYRDLSVLVIDTDSATDPTPRIAPLLPSAFVRRLDEDPGFGAASNLASTMVDGAAFYLFCHDDIALQPGAVRSMVEEAFRSNGGLVTPKIVDWNDNDRILSVGMSADKFGYPETFVDPGELDQEQHDAVRDVFLAPGGCVLVRADLFSELGGFDEGISLLGDALTLSWRAHLAGARVIVAPEAVVLHREDLSERTPGTDRRELEHRHRLRNVLSNYSLFHLVRVLPQQFLLDLAQMLGLLLRGRPGQAGHLFRAAGWNLANLGAIRQNRRAVKAIRRVPDSEVRTLQTRGSAQLTSFLRRRFGDGDERLTDLASRGRGLGARLRDPELRPAILAAVLIGIVGVIGSRRILSGGMAEFGEFAGFVESPLTLFREFLSTSQASGVGADGVPPTAYGLLGAAGGAVLGKMALLRTVLSIGLFPVAGWATWSLARRLGFSPVAAIVSVTAMVAIPLPYNALATGSWSGLLLWALAPILLHASAEALDTPSPGGDRPDRPAGSRRRTIVGLGVVLWLVTAFVPFAFFTVAAVVILLVIGSALAGRMTGVRELIIVGSGAAIVAAVLNLPWFLGLLFDGFTWASVGGTRFGGDLTADQLLRFFTGPHGAGVTGWAFPVAAVTALLIGRQWRRVWAIRLATISVGCWLLALVAEMGVAPFALPRPEVLLAPSAASVALLVGMAVACFELDLAEARFGWRQVAVGVAAIAAVGGTLVWMASAVDGRWDSPDDRVTARLALFEQDDEVWYRTLWLGESDDLPIAGRPVEAELAWGLVDAGPPTVRDRFVDEDAATSTIGAALSDVLDGKTQRFGPLLLGSGVKYVAIPLPDGSDDIPPQLAGVAGQLDQQLDLERLNVTSAMIVYRNTAWVPVVASVPADALEPNRSFEVALAFPTEDAEARLADDEPAGSVRFEGETEAVDETLLVGFGAGGSWDLTVDGDTIQREQAFGWASSYAVPSGGSEDVRYQRPLAVVRLLSVAAQVLILLGLAVVALRVGRTRRPSGSEDPDRLVLSSSVAAEDDAATEGDTDAEGDREPGEPS